MTVPARGAVTTVRVSTSPREGSCVRTAIATATRGDDVVAATWRDSIVPAARVDDLGALCSGQFLAAVGALHQARNCEQAGGFEVGEGRRLLPLLGEGHAIQRNTSRPDAR